MTQVPVSRTSLRLHGTSFKDLTHFSRVGWVSILDTAASGRHFNWLIQMWSSQNGNLSLQQLPLLADNVLNWSTTRYLFIYFYLCIASTLILLDVSLDKEVLINFVNS